MFDKASSILAVIALVLAVLGTIWNPSGLCYTIALILLSLAVVLLANGK